MSTKENQLRDVSQEIDVGVAMTELFRAIGFDVRDEQSYNWLVEYVEAKGLRTRVERGAAAVHGRCLRVGEGIEVWSALYEHGPELYYADCRPAFRSRYVTTIAPWELVEFDEDGEAVVRGDARTGHTLTFELQNLTEIDKTTFREPRLRVSVAGLAYWLELCEQRGGRTPGAFEPASRPKDVSGTVCETDYVIEGKILASRALTNPLTGADLVWLFVDANVIRLELIASGSALTTKPRIGDAIAAGVWLQGHILSASDICARFEGVDPEHQTASSWSSLRRAN
jgi:hypothetical protein